MKENRCGRRLKAPEGPKMLADHLQADELPQINMTPMVDVVLCLLVFFMAATRLYDWDENEFSVKVPEGWSDEMLISYWNWVCGAMFSNTLSLLPAGETCMP